MVQREDFEVGLPFGGKGGGIAKTADQYAETYGFKAFTDIETLKLMADLPVDDPKAKKHPVITFKQADFDALGYKGKTVGGFQYMANRVLDTLEIPYVAKTGTSKEAKKAGKVTRVLGQGKNAGEEKSDIMPDVVKIVRYGDEFNEKMYATTRAGKTGKDDEIIDHEDSPKGLIDALVNWLSETAVDFDDELITKLGLDRKMKELELIS